MSLYINELDVKKSSTTREIEKLTKDLFNHPLYRNIKNDEDIKIYMKHQIWCVWDFMTLVKSIQLAIIPPSIYWTPPKDASLGAYIYEVLLTEETDITYKAEGRASHFETYLESMKYANVDTNPILNFIKGLQNGLSYEDSISNSGITKPAKNFVDTTIKFARSPVHISVSVFCLSREGIIPGMFSRLLKNLSLSKDLFIFSWYINRHIALDSDSHGPLSIKLFKTVVDTEEKEKEALSAALEALKARKYFMDEINKEIINKSNRY